MQAARSQRSLAFLAFFGLILSLPLSSAESQTREPVYVGVNVCAECHTDSNLGNQHHAWLASKHSQAWKVLTLPESYQIAKISGIQEEPRKAAICLGCHAPAYLAEDWKKDPTYRIEDGVQCEDCHGPGSEYLPEQIMRDRSAAVAAGLKFSSPQTCLTCHLEKGTHVSVLSPPTFNFKTFMNKIAHPLAKNSSQKPVSRAAITPRKISPTATAKPEIEQNLGEAPYKTPLNAVLHPRKKELYVACEASHSVVVINTESLKKMAEIPVGMNPSDLCISPDGRNVFVSNRHDDTVSVIDTMARKVLRSLPVGDEPHGCAVSPDGKSLYVLNTSSDDISVFDTKTLHRKKILSAARGPWSLAVSPKGNTILVTNSLPQLVKFREPHHSEITAIDLKVGRIANRIAVSGTNLMMGVDWHPSGKFALATMNRTKNLLPITRLLQGWVITNGLVVIWKDGTTDQILLDEPNLGFADATDVAITPDGKYALVTSATTDRIAVVEISRLLHLVKNSSAEERRKKLPNHLGSASEIVVRTLATERSPRGIIVAPDGKKAFVANAIDDSLSVIDLKTWSMKRIDLGGPSVISKVRWGESLFHNAKITFRRQFSCHSCHPDGHVDALTYDIEADGIGVNPVDNRTLRGILDTAPFKWTGKNRSLRRQCGPRLSVFFTRIQPFTPEELSALESYIVTIPRPPNRFRPPGADFTDAQRRGKAMFERKRTNSGDIIPEQDRCVVCHDPPYYTDRRIHDVGTSYDLDTHGKFDTPHLNNIYDSPPYLHNGIAHTLEEIWTVFNPEDKHGVTNDMTKDQLNDLIEYLKTL